MCLKVFSKRKTGLSINKNHKGNLTESMTLIDGVLGGVAGVGTLVWATLIQADVPMVKEIGNFLVPFNTAVVTLMWWRINQLEKQTAKIGGIQRQLDRLGARVFKYRPSEFLDDVEHED